MTGFTLHERIFHCFRGFGRCEAGQIAVATVIVSIPLLAATGITVDYSRASRAHEKVQLIADSAALAAASAPLDGSADAIRRGRVAQDYIKAQLANARDVWVNSPPVVATTPSSVTVTIPATVKGSMSNVLDLFSKSALVGSGSGGNVSGKYKLGEIDVSAQSTASWTSGAQYGCMPGSSRIDARALSAQRVAAINGGMGRKKVNTGGAPDSTAARLPELPLNTGHCDTVIVLK